MRQMVNLASSKENERNGRYITLMQATHEHKWTYYRENNREKRVCVSCSKVQVLGISDRFNDGSVIERWDDE